MTAAGWNSEGQLGVGRNTESSSLPMAVPGMGYSLIIVILMDEGRITSLVILLDWQSPSFPVFITGEGTTGYLGNNSTEQKCQRLEQ